MPGGRDGVRFDVGRDEGQDGYAMLPRRLSVARTCHCLLLASREIVSIEWSGTRLMRSQRAMRGEHHRRAVPSRSLRVALALVTARRASPAALIVFPIRTRRIGLCTPPITVIHRQHATRHLRSASRSDFITVVHAHSPIALIGLFCAMRAGRPVKFICM